MNILIVEDEQHLLNLISEIVRDMGHTPLTAEDGYVGYEVFSKNECDLIITDGMMPNINGHQFVEMVRKHDTAIPILMVTALTEEYDELRGFDAGVNDYIAKPFSIDILKKRIEVLLSYNTSKKEPVNETIYGDLRLNTNMYEVYYKGEKIELTVKEFELLKYLIENQGRVLSRQQITEHVWGYDYYGDVRKIDTHIKNIRKKINPRMIKTVKGVGYSFVQET